MSQDGAQLLAELGFGTYAPTSTTSTIFLNELPPEPAAAIAVASYPGPAGDARIGYDQPRWQVAVRDNDPRQAEATAQAVYDTLVGLRNRPLASGAWLVLIHPVQSGPVWMPSEERGRTRYVVNLALHLHRRTVHRA